MAACTASLWRVCERRAICAHPLAPNLLWRNMTTCHHRKCPKLGPSSNARRTIRTTLGVTGHFLGAASGVCWRSKRRAAKPILIQMPRLPCPGPGAPCLLYESVPRLRVLTIKPEASQIWPILPVVSTPLKAISPGRTAAPRQATHFRSCSRHMLSVWLK